MPNTECTFSGKVIKMGDNINTDILHPPSYFGLDEQVVKEGFLKNTPGIPEDIFNDGGPKVIVAGVNFGCGSSRETTAIAFKANGVVAVVADSLSRIFYRNLVNIGLVAVNCPGVSANFENGDRIEIDLKNNRISNHGRKTNMRFPQINGHFAKIIKCGGLIGYLLNERGRKDRAL